MKKYNEVAERETTFWQAITLTPEQEHKPFTPLSRPLLLFHFISSYAAVSSFPEPESYSANELLSFTIISPVGLPLYLLLIWTDERKS